MNYRAKGFTLIELAVVIFIVSMLLGGLLSPLSQRIEQVDRADTEASLEEIEQALYGFAVTNGRMICPDCMTNAQGACAGLPAASINDGVEDQTAGVCDALVGNVATGNVPWVDLGTPQTDAWGNPFTYTVTGNIADSIASATVLPFVAALGACAIVPLQASLALCTAGAITIQNQGGGCAGAAANVATEIVAVVVSHGANATRAGNLVAQPTAVTCSEFENHINSNDGVYAFTNYADPNSGTATSYDDLMIWISPNILKNRLISAGRLP